MKHFILGTAGHVDHGKTALIKALTDIDCDTHKEEKERGITINLGFSHLNLPSGESIGIVDVPGHKDFIRTMVAGAYGIDIVLLVIAADSGIMPQTEEHLKIIELLGVEHGIVVINKVDLVDQETAELAELEIIDYLENSLFKNAPVIKVSSLTGAGIQELIKAIESILPEIQPRSGGDLFRMYIDRIFNVKGVGFVVTGSVLEGNIRQGQELFLLPGKAKKVKVKGLQRHGESTDMVIQGDRAAINLGGLKSDDYRRGMILSNKQLEETNRLDATVFIFAQDTMIGLWTNVIFYTGTFECTARMHLLDKDELHPDDTGIVQVHLSEPTVLSVKDKYIIRNTSNDKTLGGGLVIDVDPLHHKKRTDKLINSLSELKEAILQQDNLINQIKLELSKINEPVFDDYISKRIGKSLDDIVTEIHKSQDDNIIMFNHQNQRILLKKDLDMNYRDSILEELNSYHKKNPILEQGLETIEFTGKFNFTGNEAGKGYLEMIMPELQKQGLIRRLNNTWILASHTAKIDEQSREELDWLENKYLNAGMDVPFSKKINEQAHERKINKERLKMLQKYLVDQRLILQSEGEFLHAKNVDIARKKLLNALENNPDGINEKEFRELLDATRKFVQLVLGLFLKEKIIIKPKFYIKITPVGQQLINADK